MNFNDLTLVAVALNKCSRASLYAEDTRTKQRIWLGEVMEYRTELSESKTKTKLTFTLSTAITVVSEREVRFEIVNEKTAVGALLSNESAS